MNKNNQFDSSILDRAIIFAANAHKNTERRGKGFPYITHPLEAMSIVSTMTNDQELLAAACLHDVIEDTDITYEQLKQEFGERVANLVKAESDEEIESLNPSDSWQIRKQMAIDRLRMAPREVQMVALGDKLSNMRAIYRDYKEVGEDLWNRFHVTDPRLHEWHYRGLLDAFKPLENLEAYKEFAHLVNKTFANKYGGFAYEIVGIEVILHGYIDSNDVLKLVKDLAKDKEYIFDFKDVYNINFSGIRALISIYDEGYKFYIRNASKKVFHKMLSTAANYKFTVLQAPKEFSYDKMAQSGEGFTATTYFTNDGDALVKLYFEFVDLKEIEKEKRYATEVVKLGLPTPLSGDLVEVEGKHGITFERIKGKVSLSRYLADNPDKLDEVALDFANMAKKLHNTKCNTEIFPNIKDIYLNYLDNFKDLSPNEYEQIKAFINNIDNVTTCVHGDFHIGNVVYDENHNKMFIDMGDFSYGSPLFDLGTFYFVTHNFAEPERMLNMFHVSTDTLYELYKHFIQYYFDNKYSEEEADELLKPFAALTIIHFANLGRQSSWMAGRVKEYMKGILK